MVFPCIPPQNKCEWANLKEFVADYNRARNKDFRLVACLDRENSGSKEPEVLLKTTSGEYMVIERKSIVWPSGNSTMAEHNREHELFDRFVHRLESSGHTFRDGLYVLMVWERDLKGLKEKGVIEVAEQIAGTVLANRLESGPLPNTISGRKPIRWRFRVVGRGERTDDAPEVGLGYTVNLDSHPLESSAEVEEMTRGYAREVERQAIAAKEKFTKYAHCRRLFLVQFFGDGSFWLGDEEIADIIRSAELPEAIDEVWVAGQEWVALDEYEVVWNEVR